MRQCSAFLGEVFSRTTALGTEEQLASLSGIPLVSATGASDSVAKLATEFLFEAFKIGDGLLAGREYFFDHFTGPDRFRRGKSV